MTLMPVFGEVSYELHLNCSSSLHVPMHFHVPYTCTMKPTEWRIKNYFLNYIITTFIMYVTCWKAVGQHATGNDADAGPPPVTRQSSRRTWVTKSARTPCHLTCSKIMHCSDSTEETVRIPFARACAAECRCLPALGLA